MPGPRTHCPSLCLAPIYLVWGSLSCQTEGLGPGVEGRNGRWWRYVPSRPRNPLNLKEQRGQGMGESEAQSQALCWVSQVSGSVSQGFSFPI